MSFLKVLVTILVRPSNWIITQFVQQDKGPYYHNLRDFANYGEEFFWRHGNIRM